MSTFQALFNTLVLYKLQYKDTKDSQLDAVSVINALQNVTKDNDANRWEGALGVVDFWVHVANRLGTPKHLELCLKILDDWGFPTSKKQHLRMKIHLAHINLCVAMEITTSRLTSTLHNYISLVEDEHLRTQAQHLAYEMFVYLDDEFGQYKYKHQSTPELPPIVSTALQQFENDSFKPTSIQWSMWCDILESAEPYCARVLNPLYIGEPGFFLYRDRHLEMLRAFGTQFNEECNIDIRTQFKRTPRLLQAMVGDIPTLWPETLLN